jgi:8-oxo-dGTP diphosphatase
VSYRPCVVRHRSHWGPRAAAGILPFAVTADGRAWVLLSHRSPPVQAGDSWSCFGGAVDQGETPWQAAVGETGEEIRGISEDPAGILGEHIWQCPERCGWSYRTYVVRVRPHPGGRLPHAWVAAGAHAWETSELARMPAGQVTAGRQLHPAFADAWPALGERIQALGPRAGITSEQVSRDHAPACSLPTVCWSSAGARMVWRASRSVSPGRPRHW